MIAGMTRPATQHRFRTARTAGGQVVEELDYAVEARTDDGGSLAVPPNDAYSAFVGSSH
jgi:hypothetical protein